jgi:hypothetical protein
MTDREKLVELLDMNFGYVAETRADVLADFLIANGVTVREWISVEDRLPEERQNVLVHYVDGWMPIAFLLGGKWYQSGGETSWVSVTHWMPLPEPPKGE